MSDLTVPRFNVNTVEWTSFPEFGGHEAILYKSDDGTRLAGSFRESGKHTMVMPFDEFMYLLAGTAKISVEGGESFELGVGECCYLRQGMTVTMEMSEDFHDVTVLVSDTAFDIHAL
jgi:uncharacterized cupin superfamily protein